MRSRIFLYLVLVLCCSCAQPSVTHYELDVIAEYPHDTESYTQGLFFHKGQMYETTGLRGKSTLRIVDMTTGKAMRRVDFHKKYFIEGSVVLNDNLYILTWDSKVAFAYGPDSLDYKATWTYPREGWGITTDGKILYASDGSSTIYVMDENMSLQRRIHVKSDGRPVRWLNELEYIDGKIWANVYTTDEIVIIDPKDGRVEGVIDCRGLLPKDRRSPETDVLNGIAYNPDTEKIYLTGKNWPALYEVRIVRKNK